MATTFTDSGVSYAGEFAGKYISAALLSGQTLSNEEITIMPNVKFQEVLQQVTTGTLLADATCDFTASSSITLEERVIAPTELQVNLEVCKSSFYNNWQALEMGFSAHHDLPASFEDFLIAHVAEKVAQEVEYHLWQGTDGSGTYQRFDGFAQLVGTDANLPAAQEVAGTTITASNVVDELGSILDATPEAVYSRPDFKIYVAPNIARAYMRALGGFAAIEYGTPTTAAAGPGSGYNNQMSVGAKPMNFEGVDLCLAPGMASGKAIATTKSNLFFGTGLLNDANEVRLIDMSQFDGSQNVRVIMRMTAGCQVGVIEDVVTYGITNAAN